MTKKCWKIRRRRARKFHENLRIDYFDHCDGTSLVEGTSSASTKRSMYIFIATILVRRVTQARNSHEKQGTVKEAHNKSSYPPISENENGISKEIRQQWIP